MKKETTPVDLVAALEAMSRIYKPPPVIFESVGVQVGESIKIQDPWTGKTVLFVNPQDYRRLDAAGVPVAHPAGLPMEEPVEAVRPPVHMVMTERFYRKCVRSDWFRQAGMDVLGERFGKLPTGLEVAVLTFRHHTIEAIEHRLDPDRFVEPVGNYDGFNPKTISFEPRAKLDVEMGGGG